MVYHYTTLDSFYSMLASYKVSEDKDNLTFWASSALDQNDKKELSLRYDDIMKAVKMVEEQKKDLSFIDKISMIESTSLDYKKVRKIIDEFVHRKERVPFTISFSCNKDSLLMWAMYAKNGNGLCLVFDEKELVQIQPGIHLDPGKVVYDKDPNGYVNVVETYYDIYLHEIRGNRYQLWDKTDNKMKSFATMLIAISPFVKNKAFKYENEYRIAVHRFDKEHKSPVYTRITERLNTINYVKVKIPLSSLKHIVVGPCANYKRVKNFLVDNLISCHIERDYKRFISKSKIPYRIY